MPIRTPALKRHLLRLLLAALLLLVPMLLWAGPSLFATFVPEAGSTTTAATTETFVDEAESETLVKDARFVSRTRVRKGRRPCEALDIDERTEARGSPARVTLVVDFRRVKPKRVFEPPYLRPRVVRLLN